MASPLPLHGALGPLQRRLASVVLVGQAPVIVFGALTLWGLAAARDDGRATAVLVAGGVVSLLSVVTAGLLRRPVGVTLGWVVQVAMVASAILEPLAIIAALVFLALWVTALVQGRRMDALTEAHERGGSAG